MSYTDEQKQFKEMVNAIEAARAYRKQAGEDYTALCAGYKAKGVDMVVLNRVLKEREMSHQALEKMEMLYSKYRSALGLVE